MSNTSAPRRALGTMVVYGFEHDDLQIDLSIARRLNATVLEILPDWRSFPDPKTLRDLTNAEGFAIHSAHGCWGGRSIRAPRVDLAALDLATRRASIDDIKACVDWLDTAGGTFLVVHPGGLSVSIDAQRAALR